MRGGGRCGGLGGERRLDAFDGALRALHDELGGPGVAAFVLEHGRLWSVGVRGYAMIPDGLSLDDGVIGARSTHLDSRSSCST